MKPMKTLVYGHDGKELLGTVISNGIKMVSYNDRGQEDPHVASKLTSYIDQYITAHPDTHEMPYLEACYEALSKGTHKEGHLVFKTTEM